MAFSQSEKIKSGLIWVSQALSLLSGFSEAEKQGGEKAINAVINMMLHDIELAKKLSKDVHWEDVKSSIEQAVVMINSRVGSESVVHLTQALSQVTTIGQRSMSFLKEKGLL